MLTVLDEYTRECLAVARRLNSNGVLDVLAELYSRKGIPCLFRSDDESEFAAKIVRN